MHSRHIDHVKSFLLRKDLLARQSEDGKSLNIGFSAFHGAGRVAVPRILNEVGFSDIKKIKKLDQLDGMFPCFRSDPGKEQQPDPGDPRAAEIAVNAFKEEYPGEFENTDILIGTDPDADRCGVVIKVPEEQRQLYGGKDYVLLSADYAWALLIWYRLNYEVENYGKVRDAEKKFIVQSHSTSDVIIRMAQKFGIGYIKSWVGFAMLANSVRRVWDGEEIPKLHEGRLKPGDEKCHPVMYDSNGMDNGQRCFNIGAMEQSNGYSLLGGPPKDKFSLGEDGHVRDKDGTFAALLLAEIAAYAKDQGTTIYRLLDEKLFLDPEVGLFVNYYEPGPMDGEYEGLAGFTHKKNILMKAMALHEDRKPGTTLAGKEIISSTTYLTGKYDAQNWPGFPDEGIRLYFSEDKYDWLIIRPSGTSNALRFHVQLRAEAVTEENLPKQKKELLETAKAIVAEVREITGATE
jgi:phosphoglucomutase